MAADEEGSLASPAQLDRWRDNFSAYRQAPDHMTLIEWLAQFDRDHLPVAHKLLDNVQIVSELQIQEGYRDALNNLPGWNADNDERAGRWYFVGAGGAGESGPAMLRLFREANGMTQVRFSDFFREVRELPGLELTAYDNVVLVDDFAGTGDQMAGFWPILQELIASEASCFLILSAMTSRAESRLEDETEFNVVATRTLLEQDDFWSDQCDTFTNEELEILDIYGNTASNPTPRGYGECGLAFVLSHKTPNNTIPILHANHDNWVSPFPRYLLRAA